MTAAAAHRPRPAPLRLHIGGRVAKPGWTVVDIAPGPAVDIVSPCTDLSMFPADAAAEVYCSHVLEHLHLIDEVPKALAEFHRVLAPGGKLMVGVPDFHILCEMYVKPELSAQDRFFVMRMAFGGQTDPYDLHKTGFNTELLGWVLQEAGFRDIARVPGFGLFDDTSELKAFGHPIGLNAVAFK